MVLATEPGLIDEQERVRAGARELTTDGLGVGSIAIGFAFKDILQNSLAGLLLLFRELFRTGDEIEIDA